MRPEYSNFSIKVLDRNPENDREIKNFISTFPDSKSKYSSFETKDAMKNLLYIGGTALMIGGLITMFAGGLSPYIADKDRNTVMTAGFISIITGYLMLPFAIWQQMEARNDLLESIYTYNYNCKCFLKTEDDMFCSGFYFPKKDFFGNLYFRNLCGNESFTLDSNEAKEKFSIAPHFYELKNNIELNQFYKLFCNVGAIGSFAIGCFTSNPIIYYTSLPLIYLSGFAEEAIMNDVFNLLSEVNDCCCKK